MQKSFLLCIAFSIAALFSCNKPDTVGLEVQPESDAIGLVFVDSSTIITSTLQQDSLYTDEAYAVTQKNILIGSINDAVFGTTTASLYSQIKPSTTGAQTFTNSRFDSLVLTLAYKDFYGDSTVAQTFQIYELTETLVKDSNYYFDKSFTTDAVLLGTINYLPQKRTDSVNLGGTNYAPHIRIKLTDDFGKSVLSTDFTTFSDNIKGLYIKALPVTGKGGVLTFNAASALTGMSLYYIDDTTTTNVAQTISFRINTDLAFVNSFAHDYTTATNPIIFDDVIAGAEKCYLQGMVGPKTKIVFPYLKNFVSDLPKAINKAELVITVLPGTNSELAVSPRLGLALINADGSISLVPDAVSQGTTGFGGSLYNSNQYRFNIAQYVQQILTGKREDYGLSLFAAEYTQYPNRTIIAGGGNVDATIKMKLQITFTNLTP